MFPLVSETPQELRHLFQTQPARAVELYARTFDFTIWRNTITQNHTYLQNMSTEHSCGNCEHFPVFISSLLDAVLIPDIIDIITSYCYNLVIDTGYYPLRNMSVYCDTYIFYFGHYDFNLEHDMYRNPHPDLILMLDPPSMFNLQHHWVTTQNFFEHLYDFDDLFDNENFNVGLLYTTRNNQVFATMSITNS